MKDTSKQYQVHIKIEGDIWWLQAPKDTAEKIRRESAKIWLQALLDKIGDLLESCIDKKIFGGSIISTSNWERTDI